MNYRHAFHAGNHADVLKHIVLLALIDTLKRKPAPFFVLDTHAGRGLYRLHAEPGRKTAEADAGIGRLLNLNAQTAPEALARYLHAIRMHNAHYPPSPRQRFGEDFTRLSRAPWQSAIPIHGENESETALAPERVEPTIPSQNPAHSGNATGTTYYPGSPLLAAEAMREQDRLAACELQPEEAAALKQLFAGDRRVQVYESDGYDCIRALLPPKAGAARIGRALVLIDPPYEAQEAEYPRIIAALAQTLTRMPQAQCAVWYPIKQRRSLLPFLRQAAALPAKSVLLAELQVRPDDWPLRLNGSGILLLNPPWQFEQILAPVLPVLQRELGETGAITRLQWIKTGD